MSPPGTDTRTPAAENAVRIRCAALTASSPSPLRVAQNVCWSEPMPREAARLASDGPLGIGDVAEDRGTRAGRACGQQPGGPEREGGEQARDQPSPAGLGRAHQPVRDGLVYCSPELFAPHGTSIRSPPNAYAGSPTGREASMSCSTSAPRSSQNPTSCGHPRGTRNWRRARSAARLGQAPVFPIRRDPRPSSADLLRSFRTSVLVGSDRAGRDCRS